MAPEPEVPASETQTAALPPPDVMLEEVRLIFSTGSAELSSKAKNKLLDLARLLEKSSSARVQLLAYAKSDDDSTSQARRLSLSRALAARAFLIDHGVRSTRMDVRALGNIAKDGPADRVDILPQATQQ